MVARFNCPVGMMMELLDAMDEGGRGFGGRCVQVQIGGPVGSEDNIGRDIKNGARVGIVCFGQAGENQGGNVMIGGAFKGAGGWKFNVG